MQIMIQKLWGWPFSKGIIIFINARQASTNLVDRDINLTHRKPGVTKVCSVNPHRSLYQPGLYSNL